MRHLFTERYRAEDAGQLVTRTRCARCGMGSTWAGAGDLCSAPAADARAVPKETPRERWARLARDRETGAPGSYKARFIAEHGVEAWRAKHREHVAAYRARKAGA